MFFSFSIFFKYGQNPQSEPIYFCDAWRMQVNCTTCHAITSECDSVGIGNESEQLKKKKKKNQSSFICR